MEYTAGDVQKGPVLLETLLMGMISNSKLHHTIMLCMSTHHILPTYISRIIYIYYCKCDQVIHVQRLDQMGHFTF